MNNRGRARNFLMGLFAAIFGLSVISIVMFMMYTENEARIHNARLDGQAAYMLADELRQSSDDLTRMARQYAATGDQRYKAYFDEILNIRNGTAPRPFRYEGVYWDLVADTGQPPRPGEPAASLRSLVVDAGYTGAEMVLFQEAQDNSNALAELEAEAMRSVAASDLPRAIDLLNNAEYNRLKADVMRPIDSLLTTIDVRYAQEVSDGTDTRYRLIAVVMVSIAVTALLGVAGLVWWFMAFRRSGEAGGRTTTG